MPSAQRPQPPNRAAAAISSRAVLLVSFLTNRVQLPWSSFRTMPQRPALAAIMLLDDGSIENGPSFTFDRSALMSKDASLHLVTLGTTWQGTAVSRSSSSRKRSQMMLDGRTPRRRLDQVNQLPSAVGTRSPGA